MEEKQKVSFLDQKVGFVGFMKMRYFLPLFGVVILGIIFDCMPPGFGGGFLVASVLGMAMCFIGDHLPFVDKYLGGGSLIAMFAGGFCAYWGLLPEGVANVIDTYSNASDGMGFGVAALVCGSIMAMDRRILLKGGVRYFLPVISGVIVACGMVAIVGQLTGFGWRQAILFIGLPIMGGGTAAGAVPLSITYEGAMTQTKDIYLSIAMPAVVLGNVTAIVFAGLLDSLGKIKPEYTGNGKILKKVSFEYEVNEKEVSPNYEGLGVGFLVSMVFFVIGLMVAKLVPSIHYYAWTILAAAIFKISGICPDEVEEHIIMWYKFFAACFIPVTLFSIGYNFLNINTIVESFSPWYMIYVIVTVVGAVIGSWVVGKLVGFYPIESAITAGLCMANMGGSGDIATLGACKRMNLMAFAQVSSRLGGAMIIFIASILAPLIGSGL